MVIYKNIFLKLRTFENAVLEFDCEFNTQCIPIISSDITIWYHHLVSLDVTFWSMVSLRTRVTSINSSKRAEKIIKITKSEKAHLNSSEKYTYMKICASIGRSAVSLSLKIISLIIHSGQRNTISAHSFASVLHFSHTYHRWGFFLAKMSSNYHHPI